MTKVRAASWLLCHTLVFAARSVAQTLTVERRLARLEQQVAELRASSSR